LEETVYDLTEDIQSEPYTFPDSSTASPADSNMPTVQKAEDIVGSKASIVYDDCLKYLAAFVTPPVKQCTAKNVTGATCRRHPPFLVNIQGKGTASVLEWVCDTFVVTNYVNVHFKCKQICNLTYKRFKKEKKSELAQKKVGAVI